MDTIADLDAAAVLAAARRERAEADAAEARVLSRALAWAELHRTEDGDLAATWGDSPVPLAGEGAPLISEFCVAEFAAALGMSTSAGRSLLAQVLELAHRLPRVWARVLAGSLPSWKARRIAERSLALSAEAAAHLDRQVAPFAHRVGLAALERAVEEAIGAFMPAYAAELAEQAADGRHVRIEHAPSSPAGTSYLSGELDVADALDLDRALQAGARQLASLGSTESLEVRRSQALGALARDDRQLELDRDVTLYVHLSPESNLAELEARGTHLLTAEQVRAWCGSARVTVKPVIDLAESRAAKSYEIPDRIRDQVVLRDRACVFPWCERNARRCDLDHIVPFDGGGTTSTENLAPLCRRHHRLKTFGGWSYSTIEAGVYLWRSPQGYAYLRDGVGTRDLTPRPVDPPG